LGDFTSNHSTLNIRSALINLAHPNITINSLNRKIAHIAIATMNLLIPEQETHGFYPDEQL
jgi:hypothetical protein